MLYQLLRMQAEADGDALSTLRITWSSTRPICSRRRFLSNVLICSSRTTESLGRPKLWADREIWVGQAGLSRLGRDGRRNHRWAVLVAGVVLDDEDRADAPLFTAHHRAEIGVKNVASFHTVVHVHSHSAGK